MLKAIEEGRLRGVSTTIVFGEIRYVYLREDKPGFEIARAAIEAEANLRTVAITVLLAVHAAERLSAPRASHTLPFGFLESQASRDAVARMVSPSL